MSTAKTERDQAARLPVNDTQSPPEDRWELLGVYLNDHLAGATAGTELARRMAGAENALGHDFGPLAADIEHDRDALLDIMRALDVPVRRHRIVLGLLGERVGRLKPNRRVVRRSPLSALVEMETLRLGVEGKAALWRVLRALAERDDRLEASRLDGLLERAVEQSKTLEKLRTAQAERTFPLGSASRDAKGGAAGSRSAA